MGRKRKPLPLLENVCIEDIGAEGKSLARVENMVVFVKEAIPGDVTDLQVFRKKGRYMEARVVHYHSYSDQRTEPFCEHFGVCGGCKWQHLPYDRQLFYKQQQVEDAFRHIAGVKIPESMPIIPSGPTTEYRNKMEFTFSCHRWLLDHEAASDLPFEHTNAVGLHVPGRFDKVVDIEKCHLQGDPANPVKNFMRELALEKGVSFYDHRTNEGLMRNLIIRTSTLGEVMVILSVQFDEPVVYEILDELKDKFPGLTSLMYTINPKKNETLYDQDILVWAGRDHIFEKLEELTFKIGPKSFFQTNSFQALELYRKTREFAGLTGKETVYDLYTGTGTIANFIASNAGKVVGIESVPEAIEDAEVNSEINNISNTSFFSGDMKDIFTGSFIKEQGKPDVIITDPPRAGMHAKVVEQILKIAPERIVYVSCNPATQARDVEILGSAYQVTRIQPVDMFPHTHHVENIALLERKPD
ncbi:MAG: 23S rRNA (uracil(1939)-C(5))-methyltransferase RlmD [Bacteroidetes bacterium]|nr:23S rRNA (uracil(1939)-C(5))-methyltransferase RlmD [Bacteroidota bacterium]